MTTTQQEIITPALGCSPSDGLPRDCQGRHVEPNRVSGAGKDSSHAAVPGSSEPGGAAALFVFDSFREIGAYLEEMRGLMTDWPHEFSLKQVWFDCESIETQLKELKAQAIRCLDNDFPPVVHGYKDIPA